MFRYIALLTAVFSLKQFAPGICPSLQKNWFENNRKISITKEICITIDPPEKIPERKSDSEAGYIFENFTPKQGNPLGNNFISMNKYEQITTFYLLSVSEYNTHKTSMK